MLFRCLRVQFFLFLFLSLSAGPVLAGELVQAVLDGNTVEAIRLLEAGADPDDSDGWGNSAMLYAATKGRFKILDALIEHGADPCAPSRDGDCVLHAAVRTGDRRIVSALLDRGFDIERMSHNGETPLHLAASVSDWSMCRLLLKRGADMHAGDRQGETPLHRAAQRYVGCQVAQYLVERGADLEARDERGRTPLHLAAFRGSMEGLFLLLQLGADPNAVDQKGMTPLHSASGQFGQQARAAVVVGTLIASGADPDHPSQNGTPLEYAVRKGEIHVALALVNCGAKQVDAALRGKLEEKGYVGVLRVLDSADDPTLRKVIENARVMHRAAMKGDVETIRTLVAEGVSPDILSYYSDRPLCVAVSYGRFEAVKCLLELGALVDAPARDGRTALRTVWSGGMGLHTKEDRMRMAKLLLDAGADVRQRGYYGETLLEIAMRNPDSGFAEILLKYGADPAIRGERGDNALTEAADGPNAEKAIALLLDHGMDPDSRDKYGRTPLFNAAMRGDVAACRLLVEKGADVNASAGNFGTPLYNAAFGGKLEVCRYLLDSGADVNATAGRGRTPLHAAAIQNKLDVCRLLVDRGADFEARDKEGRSPLDLAEKKKYADVAAYLRSLD